MLARILEADWKRFRELRAVALDRFCQRTLDELGRLATDTRRTSHERYLAVFSLIHQRDKELADAFNDPRRSTALIQLGRLCSMGLLSDEEFDLFSPETREFLNYVSRRL
jgi:hypothetical protein